MGEQMKFLCKRHSEVHVVRRTCISCNGKPFFSCRVKENAENIKRTHVEQKKIMFKGNKIELEIGLLVQLFVAPIKPFSV